MTEAMPSPVQPRKRPQQTRSRAQVAKILASTRALLRDGGVDALTTVNIARQAGISIGSFYQYFPNKKAVLLALYEEYRAGLLASVAGFNDDAYRTLGWQEFFTKVFRVVKSQEKLDGYMRDLANVVRLYPEMQAIDQQRGQASAEFTAGHLARLGARGTRRELEQLAWFIYELNNGIWLYQTREGHTPASLRRIVDWEVQALLSVVATVFPADAGAPGRKQDAANTRRRFRSTQER